MNEIWKDIKGYEGYYQVSDQGRIKGLKRFVNNNKNKRLVKEKIIKQSIGVYGYKKVALYKHNKQKDIKVHRLAAETFIYNKDNKPQINHKDGIKTNNNVSNLEWVTAKENIQHAYNNGLIKNRKKVIMLNLNEEPLKIFESMTQAGLLTKIQTSHISECCNSIQKTAGGYKWKYKEE